jgi:segregation and condensation protein B
MKHLLQHIESIIFVSDQPVKVQEILQVLNFERQENPLNEEDIAPIFQEILDKYKDDIFPFKVDFVGGGYQFLTKTGYYDTTARYLNQKMKKRLSRAAMETLAVIAYKQPVTKPEMERIRGVNCDYTIQKLMEKELVDIAGRSDEPGRPLLYVTSEYFMDYFGLNSIKDLPKIKELEPENILLTENRPTIQEENNGEE